MKIVHNHLKVKEMRVSVKTSMCTGWPGEIIWLQKLDKGNVEGLLENERRRPFGECLPCSSPLPRLESETDAQRALADWTWKKLDNCKQQGCLVSGSSGSVSLTDEEFLQVGLLNGHVYSIHDVQQVEYKGNPATCNRFLSFP